MFSTFKNNAQNFIKNCQNGGGKKAFNHTFSEPFFDIEIYDELSSTNDYLKENSKGKERAVLALSQTAGRGRYQRKFFSPKNAGLYLSVLIKRDLPIDIAFKITAYTGVVVLKAVQKFCNQTPSIKWVNDIVLNGKKVAGILTETNINSKKKCVDSVIIGIGVNLYGNSFDESIKNIATSIERETGDKINYLDFALEILKGLYDIDKQILKGDYINDYRKYSCVIGKEVLVSQGEQNFLAKVLDVLPSGELKVGKAGEEIILSAGEISIKLK